MGDERTARRGTLFGVLTLLCGVLAISAPLLFGLGVAWLIGAALLAGGVLMLVFALRADSLGGVVVRTLFAGLTLLAGLALVGRPDLALAELTLLVGIYFIIDGFVSMVIAWNIKPRAGWGWVTTNGAVSIALGYLVLSGWPASALWAVGVLVGVRLLLAGIAMLALGAPRREA